MPPQPALIAFFPSRFGNSFEAEDVAQGVIFNELKNGHWDSVEEANSYIFTIASDRWIDRVRRRWVTDGFYEAIPLLKADGFTQDDLDIMMKRNPARFMGFAP